MIRLALAMGLSQAGFHAFVASLPLAMVAVGRPDGEIGAIMGSAAVFNLLAALASGGLIDRYGGRVVYLAGTALLALAALLLGSGIIGAEASVGELLLVRALQGIGLAGVLPAVASLVPGIVSRQRLPTALAFVGVAANVSLALTPPFSIALLESSSLQAVGAGTAVVVALGIALLVLVPGGARQAPAEGATERPRRFRPAWRPSWASPLLVSFLFVAHWGVVTGYLPQRAEAAGADIGLFFTGDALALLAVRVPAGWMAGRIGVQPLVVVGVAVTVASLSILLLPPTTPLLVLSGVGMGTGGALALPTMMIELSQRSDATDRGSAFGLYSVAFGSGIAVGSIGVAPFYSVVGFEVALGVGIVACALGGIVALLDRAMRHPPEPGMARAT